MTDSQSVRIEAPMGKSADMMQQALTEGYTLHFDGYLRPVAGRVCMCCKRERKSEDHEIAGLQQAQELTSSDLQAHQVGLGGWRL